MRGVAGRTLRLEETNRAKSEFMANVTYELGTPLNSVIGFAEVQGGRIEVESEPGESSTFMLRLPIREKS